MTGKLRDLTVNRDGTQNITVTVSGDFSQTFDALKDHPVTVEIKKTTKGRSKPQNAFMWSLCSDIGRVMNPPLDKEDVYRRAIKAVGVFTSVAVPSWQIKTLIQRWEDHGTGWFSEIVDDFSIGSKWVHLYYGTSTYTTEEMKVVIDWLIDEAEQCGIVVPVGKEREEMYHDWGFC